jgi:hypothetical protein
MKKSKKYSLQNGIYPRPAGIASRRAANSSRLPLSAGRRFHYVLHAEKFRSLLLVFLTA